MKAKDAPGSKREVSYGENRSFRGLEDFAIRRRLRPAQQMLKELSHQNPAKNFEVLELGCGFLGRNLTQLSKDYANIRFTGVDLSVSKDVSGIQLIEDDISTWKPSHEYDAVLSLAVVEHLSNPQGHFDLIATCLKDDGLAGLTTPGPQAHLALDVLSRLGVFDRSEILDHKLYLTERGTRLLAKNSGLLVQEFRTFSLGMNQWILLRNS